MTQENSIVHSNRESIFSVFFIVLGFFWNDVINYSIATPIGSSVMLVDALFFFSIFYAIKDFHFFKGKKWMLLLYGTICCYMLFGFFRFDMKALSDSRQYYHFFFLFLGFAFVKKVPDTEFITTLFRVIFSLAIGSFLLFLVEIIIGHSFGFAIAKSEETQFGLLEDQRGIRILGSTETFNLCLFILFYLFFNKQIKLHGLKIITLIFLIAVIITQNRTPIIAAIIGYLATQVIFLRIKKGRVHWVFVQLFFAVAALLVVYLLDYYGLFPLFSTLKSAISIDNDEIGTTSFRLIGALAAIQIFLSNFLFGEGLGRGWDIDYGFAVLNIAPHNQYASILAKFGLIGFLAFLVWMTQCFGIIKKYKKVVNANDVLVRFSMVLFFSQIPYGFGFDYHPFFPFFVGMLLTRLTEKNYETTISNYSNI